MGEVRLRGLAAAGGHALGRAIVLRDASPVAGGDGGEVEQARARAALEEVAAGLRRETERLRAAGLEAEAEILAANELMALDPALAAEVAEAAAGMPAAAALVSVSERHAAMLAGLGDPLLAARADDVRQIGRRAAAVLSGSVRIPETTEPAVLVARDLGPADVAELQASSTDIRGIALAGGAATSHAAIMARALGLPLVVALGEPVLECDGEQLALDGDLGVVVVGPGAATLDLVREQVRAAERERERLAAGRRRPAVTRDGHEIALLCNAATAADVRSGLEAGAAGAGLIRTELAFLEASAWPREEEHAAALAPLLELLAGRVATVRTLDFGEDKTPPFLAGTPARGLPLLLDHAEHLRAQLRAIVRTGRNTQLRVLLPMTETAEQVRAARALLEDALTIEGWRGEPPQLGAMIETPSAARRARELADECEFLSIGTNDLVQYTLGLDRLRALAGVSAAADPAVLALVAEVGAAAAAAGVPLEVCGEAAGEPALALLLIGLGVDELSAAPARLDALRDAVCAVDAQDAAEVARAALRARSASQALELACALISGQVCDEIDQTVDRLGRALS